MLFAAAVVGVDPLSTLPVRFPSVNPENILIRHSALKLCILTTITIYYNYKR